MMRTGKHFKGVMMADLSTPTSTPRFITYKPLITFKQTRLPRWLGGSGMKIVCTPDLKIEGRAAWGFKGLIPDGWIKV